MKRWFFATLALALCVSLAVPAAAQKDKGRWGPGVWSGGATVGPVASDLTGDAIESSQTRWGPIVGAWLQYWATDNLAVSFEGIRSAKEFSEKMLAWVDGQLERSGVHRWQLSPCRHMPG